MNDYSSANSNVPDIIEQKKLNGLNDLNSMNAIQTMNLVRIFPYTDKRNGNSENE